MQIDTGLSDGWFAPDTGPTPQQAPIVHRARWILQAELAGDDTEAVRVANQISTGFGWPGIFTAMAVWCDSLVAHTGDQHAPTGPVGLTIPDVDPRPHVRWTIELIRARAAWDRPTWTALLAEMPRHDSRYCDTVVRWIALQIMQATVHRLPPPRLRVQVAPVGRGLPHGWRECRLRARQPPDADPDEIAQIQAAIDSVWQRLPASGRRLVHGYMCHQRRDAVSRQVMDRVQRQTQDQVSEQASEWQRVRPTGDRVKLDLGPKQWSADPPGARLRMVADPVAVHHTVPGLAHVGGLRWTTEDGPPVPTAAVVRVDALPPEIRLMHLEDDDAGSG